MSDALPREARQCLQRGKKALEGQRFEKAKYFFRKSLEIQFSEEGRQLLSKALRGGMAGGASPSSAGASAPSGSSPRTKTSSSAYRSSGTSGSPSPRSSSTRRTQAGASSGRASSQKSSSGTSTGGTGSSSRANRRNGTSSSSQRSAPRAASSSKSGAPRAASSSKSGASASTAAPPDCPVEHVQICTRVISARTHYERLGVTTSSTEREIVKAYRKLSVKVHPDRNRAPQAEEAFKLLSNAHQCLTDADRRAFYDRHGCRDEQEVKAAAAAANSEMYRRRGRDPFGFGGGGGGVYYAQDDFTPQDLFDLMFGGGMRRRQQRTRVHRDPRRAAQTQHTHGARGGGGGLANDLRRLAPMFGLLLLLVVQFAFSGTGSQQQSPVFTFNKDPYHKVQRFTSDWNVPFFVDHTFERTYLGSGRSRKQRLHAIEQEVETEYLTHLGRLCNRDRKRRQHTLAAAERSRDEDRSNRLREQAMKMKMTKCKEYEKFTRLAAARRN